MLGKRKKEGENIKIHNSLASQNNPFFILGLIFLASFFRKFQNLLEDVSGGRMGVGLKTISRPQLHRLKPIKGKTVKRKQSGTETERGWHERNKLEVNKELSFCCLTERKTGEKFRQTVPHPPSVCLFQSRASALSYPLLIGKTSFKTNTRDKIGLRTQIVKLLRLPYS